MTTLSTALNHAVTTSVDISQVSTKEVVKVLRGEFGDNPYDGTFVKPEAAALEFYLSNHVIGLLRTKYGDAKAVPPAGAELLERYVENTTAVALRAFSYLLLICSREMRHCKGSDAGMCGITLAEAAVYNLLLPSIIGKHGNHVATFVWCGDVKPNIGEYVSVLEKVFRKGKWHGGYGGPKWADVTLCLLNYVKGIYTAEMMVDTVWTLCHNGGPIFNKGMLYYCHTSELMRVLDVQRAGQIPNFVWGDWATHWYSDFFDIAAGQFPELMLSANLELIKLTALHNSLWTGDKYKTPGLKTVKPATHGQGGVVVKVVKMEREDA